MSAASLAHLHGLALRALDAQERRVGELRGRLAPVLAAGGVGATLLSGPALGAAASGGLLSLAPLALAAGGLLLALGSAWPLLTAKVGSESELFKVVDQLHRSGQLADDDAYFALFLRAARTYAKSNDRQLAQLERAFTAMLCGIHVCLCGLALSALLA